MEWRGKPVGVVRRTPDMLAALQGHDAELVDPLSAIPPHRYASDTRILMDNEVAWRLKRL